MLVDQCSGKKELVFFSESVLLRESLKCFQYSQSGRSLQGNRLLKTGKQCRDWRCNKCGRQVWLGVPVMCIEVVVYHCHILIGINSTCEDLGMQVTL